MARSKWKGPYINKKLLESIKNYKKNKQIFTNSRNSTIIPIFVNKTINVHNGKIYQKLKIIEIWLDINLESLFLLVRIFLSKKIKSKYV